DIPRRREQLREPAAPRGPQWLDGRRREHVSTELLVPLVVAVVALAASMLAALAGFGGAWVLFDPASDRQMGLTLWESESAAEAALRELEPIRQQAAQRMGATATAERYEVIAQI